MKYFPNAMIYISLSLYLSRVHNEICTVRAL